MLRRLLLTLAIGGAVAACGTPDPSTTPAESPSGLILVHHDVTDFPGQIRNGTLAVSGGCVGLERTGVPFVVLLWPPGYELDPTGRGVLDPAGASIGELGSFLEVGGSDPVPDSGHWEALERSRVMETCPDQEYLLVAEVITGP